MTDPVTYHRRRAAQHRRMIEVSDPHYASIHRAMADMHEERAVRAEAADSGDAYERPALPK